VSVQTYAELSNGLVYSTMVVLVLALLAFSAELASGSRGRVGRSVAAPARELVGAAAAAGAGAAPAPPAVRSVSDHRADRFGRVGLSLTVLAALLLLGAGTFRGLAAGRAPWGNMYEFSVISALALTVGYLVLVRRLPRLRPLGVFVVGAALLVLGLAATVLYVDAGPLVPALQSFWLVIHVAAAIVSGAVFTLGGVATALFLVQERGERLGRAGRLSRLLPTAEQLERAAYRMFAFVFPLWTFAIVSGAIWAEHAWSRYWGWDPKETWALITWIVFAGYLHARATAGWRGRGVAVIALIGLSTFVFNYFGVNLWFSGLHSYGGLPTR